MSIFTAPHIPHHPSRLHLLEGAVGMVAVGAIVIAGFAWRSGGDSTSTSTSAPSAPSISSIARPAPAPQTYFVASTQAMADDMAVAIEDGNRIRAASGLGIIDDRVFFMATVEEVAAFEANMADGNRLVEGMAMPTVTVTRIGSFASAPVAPSSALPAAGLVAENEPWAYSLFGPQVATPSNEFLNTLAEMIAMREAELAGGIAMHDAAIAAFLATGP